MDCYKKNEDNFNFKKSRFINELKEKHHNVKDKRIILFMKHVYLKKIVIMFQISIIIASTIITFMESLKPHIFMRSRERQTQIVSICLSTYIAISTAIFKFIKIDDRKEEIYKILQTFNETETIVNQKIKQVRLLQSRFEDEMLFFEKSKLCVFDDTDQDKNVIVSEDCCNPQIITKKYYGDFYEILKLYEQEEIDKKILDAKKQFHTMFSYNEIIYYKGKIVESMLLERVHAGNRTILEAPMEEYKYHLHMMKQHKDERDELCKDLSENYIDCLEKRIDDHKYKSDQIYNEDYFLNSSNCFNNICLYFSNLCHFCLIMNLYLSLTIKRLKFRSLKRTYDKNGNNKNLKAANEENDEIGNIIRFLCCRCKLFDCFVRTFNCQDICCCSLPENEEQNSTIVYYCCDC